MHPDCVFFHEIQGKFVASILDPHGYHLDDALMKLKALAAFAATYGDAFHRIEALAEVDGRMKVIDMKTYGRRAVAVREETAEYMYRSNIAVDYNPDKAR